MSPYSNLKLISFVGIDGSGKTTLAHLLADEMRARGFKCSYIYGRYKPILAKPLVLLGKYWVTRNHNIKKYSDYSRAKMSVAKKHSLISSIYVSILLSEYIMQITLKILIPQMMGNIIICDRYVYDTVINDIPRTDANLFGIKKTIDMLFNIAPKPDLAFHIVIPEDIAFRRKDDTPSVDYLIERSGFYNYFAEEYKMINLDGTKSTETLKNEVMRQVLK